MAYFSTASSTLIYEMSVMTRIINKFLFNNIPTMVEV